MATLKVLKLAPLVRFTSAWPQGIAKPTFHHRWASQSAPSQSDDPYPLPLQHPEIDTAPETTVPHPLDVPRQVNEDTETLKARLIYQTRKRGTLETGLLLSTFATVDRIKSMSREELQELDRLMTIPEWTLYYWAVGKQEPGTDSEWRQSKILGKVVYFFNQRLTNLKTCKQPSLKNIQKTRINSLGSCQS